MTDARDIPDFRFEYDPGVVRFGPGAVADLGDELARLERERALVVCGRTVGETPGVMDPIRGGLDDHLAGVFAETTPEKRLGTAIAGAEAFHERDADAVVAVGGGSSLDLAKAVSVVAARDDDPEDLGREFEDAGTLDVPDSAPPVLAVPTTLAGADLAHGAGLNAAPETCPVEDPVSGGLGDPRLMPVGVFYDLDLFATTPRSVLAGSAMNGFDKGIETLFARTATPITDATGARGLSKFHGGLLAFEDDHREGLPDAVEGLLLVRYGTSRPDAGTLSLIHAFGHGITNAGTVQQGVAHGVIAPHALRYLFEQVDGRRDLVADALGVGDADDPAEAIVSEVERVRDALDLPARLRDVDGPDRDEFEAVAEDVLADSFMANAPEGLDPSVTELEAVLENAW